MEVSDTPTTAEFIETLDQLFAKRDARGMCAYCEQHYVAVVHALTKQEAADLAGIMEWARMCDPARRIAERSETA